MSKKRTSAPSKSNLTRAATEAQTRSLDQINQIAQSTNAQALFASVLLHLAHHHGEAPPSEATHGSDPAKLELLAYHLYPYFENESGSQPTTPQTLNCIKALEALFSALRILQSVGPETENELSVVAEVRRHAEVVRGSAYPEQTTSRILEVQGTFENWFRRELGIGPRRAQEIIREILWACEQKANHILEQATEHSAAIAQAWKEAKANSPSQRSSQQTELLAAFRKNTEAETQAFTDRLNQLVLPNLPVSPQDLVDLGQPPTPEEWSALSNLVGLTIESRRSITSPVDVRRRPLFFLPDGRVLLVEVSNLLDNLWEAFESTAKKDSKFFARYVEKRTQWVETKIFKVLTTIFPPEHVYRNLAYPDIDYAEKRTAELDFAVDWGPFLVLIEAKAGQFRLEGQLHDRGRLFTDLKNNVEDAFEQARRALRYIDNESSPEFSEIKGARKLVVRKGDIRRTYILSISLHHLGTVATRLAALSELGLFRDKDYPLSISVSDLEVVATFIEGPDVFLHYIEKRLILQRHSTEIFSDELDLFGAYLDTRLQATRLHLDRQASFLWLTGYSEAFDRWVQYQRGELEETPEIELRVPGEIRAVLHELRQRQDDAARWIAFALLDMSDDLLEATAKGFRELQSAKLIPGMFRRGVHFEGDTVVSLVGTLAQGADEIEVVTRRRAVVEKYRRKLSKSIGFGLIIPQLSRPFHSATWVEGPWSEDPVMNQLLSEEPDNVVPAPGMKLPGRNEPCFCGSGKKFKKCHLPRLGQALS